MQIDFNIIGTFAGKTLVALGLGMAIGIERQLGQHPAGLRTNALVCLGSALFVSLSSVLEDGDHTRIAAQVVSGIGFICGGAILREGINVRGMNTAATLWCTAAIGCLVGAGAWDLAIFGTIAIISAHFIFRPVAHFIDHHTQGKEETELLCDIKIICLRAQEDAIRTLLLEQIQLAKLRLQGLSLQDATAPDQVELKVHLYALQHNEQAMNDLVSRVASQAAVSRVSWSKAH